MRLKGLVVVCGLALLLTAIAPALAQEEGTEPEAASLDEEQGFGDKFSLYLEAQVGSAASDGFSTSINTTDTLLSKNSLEFDEVDHARLTIGWRLPEDKGIFKLMFNGWKETDYTFNGSGQRLEVSDPSTNPISTNLAESPVQWWQITISDGMLVSTAQEPTWNPNTDDSNGDGIPNEDEISFSPVSFGTTRDVTDSLDNQLQVADLLYERGWGGRKFSGTWSAGVRYFAYEGNTPTAAWLRGGFIGSPGSSGGYQGYTDGAGLRVLNFTQDTEAYGPTGSVEFGISFFRQRFLLFWEARAAFVIQDSETDSGQFFTLVDDSSSGNLLTATARVQESRSKDVWHTAGQMGFRVRVAPGLTFTASYFLEQYADALLMPTTFSIPGNAQQVNQGTEALFATRDIRLDGWRSGLSFQF